MDTVISISIKDIIFLVVGISVSIFFIYLAMLIKNLIPTVKKTNAVMDDVKVITEVAADNAQSVQHIITNVSSSAEELSKALRSNPNIVKVIASLAKTIAIIKGVLNKNAKNNEDDINEEEA